MEENIIMNILVAGTTGLIIGGSAYLFKIISNKNKIIKDSTGQPKFTLLDWFILVVGIAILSILFMSCFGEPDILLAFLGNIFFFILAGYLTGNKLYKLSKIKFKGSERQFLLMVLSITAMIIAITWSFN